MHKVTRKRFQMMVRDVMESLPKDILARIENLEIVIEDAPTPEDYEDNDVPDDEDLFGLFEGIPLTERAFGDDMSMPNIITIFQFPHEEACDTLEDLQAEVRQTVRHEVAHYFGISDERLDELGAY